jgi:hypothetical protein
MSIREKLISGQLGFSPAPLGNMFRYIPAAEAAVTVDVAWQQGIRYMGTAPLYGAGLSEMHLGRALAKHKRDEYVLSSSVDRLILGEAEPGPRQFGEKRNLFDFGRPSRTVYDYSADGTLRSIAGTRPERIAERRAALTATIPGDFWRELREQGLVTTHASLPSTGNSSMVTGPCCIPSIDSNGAEGDEARLVHSRHGPRRAVRPGRDPPDAGGWAARRVRGGRLLSAAAPEGPPLADDALPRHDTARVGHDALGPGTVRRRHPRGPRVRDPRRVPGRRGRETGRDRGPARTRSAEYGRPRPHPGNERPVRGDGSPSPVSAE